MKGDAEVMGFRSSEELLEWQNMQEKQQKRTYPDIIYKLVDSVYGYQVPTKSQILLLAYAAYLEGKQQAIDEQYKSSRSASNYSLDHH